MNLRVVFRVAAIGAPVALASTVLVTSGLMNLGQVLTWIAFLASLVAGLSFLALSGGREGAAGAAKIAFHVQWLALLGSAVFLWRILFTHQFQYEYVASYSSRSMPGHYVYAAFWGGQEGTFLLWALITCTLGLVLMRVRHSLTWTAMFFLNLPLVMLGLVTVMRGPFLTFPAGRIPLDGQGLNPLLQDPWMTIHPPVLFTGFSSLVVPYAIAMAGLVKRDYDGWLKPALPWSGFSLGILATGFIMGGVWAYKVLGWGGYWGWDPVENGSFIPWLCNAALLHGLLVQRVTGSLRRTNFFLAVTSYVLVLYASFLTRSGVLADFSVHSFVNLGLNGFLLSFLFVIAIAGYGALLFRMRDIPAPKEPLGTFSRESIMWLGQLVFMLMCALTAVGMSAPLITRLFGPASNVQTSYYNLVNAPLAVALGLVLGLAPLMRWRHQETRPLLQSVRIPLIAAVVVTVLAMFAGVRQPLPAAVVFGAAWALAANTVVTIRGFRSGWKHGLAFLGHMGASLMLIGIVASSKYGSAVQVQLPQGQDRTALGYHLKFQGVRKESDGKDRVMIAVNAPERRFEALPSLYWSAQNQGYMKKPHIERFLTHDIYISPLEMVGDDPAQNAIWFRKGETRQIGETKYTFVDFDRQMGDVVRVAARMRVEIGGRTVPARPVLEMNMQTGTPNSIPDYLPGGGSVQIASVDPNTGRVALQLPGMGKGMGADQILAVEVSTKPLINLVWLGAIVMLASAFMSAVRRAIDVKRMKPAAAATAALVAISLLIAPSARASKSEPVEKPLPRTTVRVIRLGSRVSTPTTCVLGPTGSAAGTVDYLEPPNDAYYALLRSSRCPSCAPNENVVLGTVHLTLSFQAECTQPVEISIVGALGDTTCPTPDPSNVICSATAHDLTPGSAGTFQFDIALQADCSFRGDAFLSVNFPSLDPNCVPHDVRPLIVLGPPPCPACAGYNIQSGNVADMCVAPAFSGLMLMNVDSDVCLVPVLPRSWGALKVHYR